MNKTKTSSILGIFLVVSVLVVGLTGLASASPQVWYLDDSVTVAGTNDMDKNVPDTTESTVTLNTGTSKIWIANEVAAVNVGYPAGTWDGWVYLTSDPKPGLYACINVDVGYWDTSAGSFVSGGFATNVDPDEYFLDLNIVGTAFTVSATDYLAVKFTNNCGNNTNVDTGGDTQSNFKSPSGDPGYPYPELSTLVLLSFGLLALFGYVAYRRRNNKQ